MSVRIESTDPPAATADRTELLVSGMTCSNCARHVTEALQSVPGVAQANVSLDENRATLRWQQGATRSIEAALNAVKAAGYEASEASQETGHTSARAWSPLAGWRFNVVVGLAATVPLMLGEWVFGWGGERWFGWIGFALALVVQVTCGARFYLGAWRQLLSGSSNMDTLVALGSTTAFAYSAWALFSGAPGHFYFMEAAAIITLISLGHWLEARMSERASSSLKALLQLAPERARRRNQDGSESEVPVAELRPGDLLVLKPGDRVPTDAEAVEGEFAVDESMLTGESLPVDKSTGAKLYAGTVNLNGRLVARVTATGETTALAQIIAAVQRAQNSRADIQRLGDRVSSVFVPVVVLIALGAAAWWGLAPEQAREVNHWLGAWLWPAHPPVGRIAAAVIAAASVLIIACPCAMGLATPAAIMAGTNAAARRGILIRDGVALEKAGRVTAVLFDKTGTLTAGKPDLAQSAVFEIPAGLHEEDVRALAVSLAAHSNHPISQAVARGGVQRPSAISKWQEHRGAGVEARWPSPAGQEIVVRLGALRWLGEAGVNLAAAQSFATQWSAEGATLVGLAGDNTLLAAFAVKDTLKPGAREVVEQLTGQGMKVFLVTGDSSATAASIARQVGLAPENVFAEVRPEEKSGLVRRLQSQGARVAFVGDGINDAPALEQADLGIAVSQASDVAREAADIILLKSGLEAVPESLGLARATLRTIKQNLFWAFFYNAVGVPLAALGFLSPVLCAAAMGLSDVIVIGNALRLRRWKLK